MALPTSGALSFSAIATEIYGSTGTNRSLHTMSLAAGKTTPDNVSEFYGYSHTGSISLSTTTSTYPHGTGLGVNTLTSSGPWTALVGDPDGVVTGAMTSGTGSGKVTFSYDNFGASFYSNVTITYSLTGSVPLLQAYWNICIEGTSVLCP
jgi:hypothetical protein